MAAQPQTYGSIREFLDNLPKQPCIWQPENPNICVTCLRINEPIARVCSVWAQALDEAPLEEIDFEEEVKSLPSVVEIEDDFEVMEEGEEIQIAEQVVAEVDIVAGGGGLDTPEAEPVVEEAVEAEPVVEEAVEAEPVVEEGTVEAEAIPEEIQDAIEAETVATENIEAAIVAETNAIEAVAEATETVAEAVKGYAEAVAEEGEAAEAVVEAVEAETIATDAVVEAAEQVTELVETEAAEEEVKKAVEDLEKIVDEKEEAEAIVAEAVTAEEVAAEEVETTVEDEAKAVEKLEEAVIAEEESTEELAEALVQEEEVSEELADELNEKIPEEAEEDTDAGTENEEGPFVIGDEVSHVAYGDGTVNDVRKTGKHWLIKIVFDSGERTILGSETFLSLKGELPLGALAEDKKEGAGDEKSEEDSDIYQKPSEEKETPEDGNEEKTEESGEKEEETEVLETVMAEAVVPEAEDYGDYEPGTKVKHAIFGIGEVKNSRPKGENYRLDIDFEDGSSKTLLSTFIDIHDGEVNETEVKDKADEKETVEAEVVVAESVEDKTVEENVEAEAVIAEPVEAEAVLDTDVVYRRPKEKDEEAETVIDLSKPEVQDAEIVDEED